MASVWIESEGNTSKLVGGLDPVRAALYFDGRMNDHRVAGWTVQRVERYIALCTKDHMKRLFMVEFDSPRSAPEEGQPRFLDGKGVVMLKGKLHPIGGTKA